MPTSKQAQTRIRVRNYRRYSAKRKGLQPERATQTASEVASADQQSWSVWDLPPEKRFEVFVAGVEPQVLSLVYSGAKRKGLLPERATQTASEVASADQQSWSVWDLPPEKRLRVFLALQAAWDYFTSLA